MLKNNFLKRVVSSSLISAIFLNSSFITRAGVLVENKSYKTQENLKCEQKVNKNKSEKNNFSETLKDFLLYGTVGLVGIGGTGCLIYEAVKLIKNWCNESDEEPEEKPKKTPKPKVRLRKDSPFACLMQYGGNCYINSTLHILHMDPEFRKYVKDIANNCAHNINECNEILNELGKIYNKQEYIKEQINQLIEAPKDIELETLFWDKSYQEQIYAEKLRTLRESNENFEPKRIELEEKLKQIKYKSLDLVFEDMDKEDYRGSIIPHSDAKKTFEKAIGHRGWNDPLIDVFSPLCHNGMNVVNLESTENGTWKTDCFKETLNKGTSNETPVHYTLDEYLSTKNINSNKIWCTFNSLRAEGTDDCTVPTNLNFNNGNNYELKGFVYGGSGHYYCYKMGDNHVWYRVDGCGEHNDAISGDPPLKMRTEKNYGVTLAYYQKS